MTIVKAPLNGPLGQRSENVDTYTPSLLVSLERASSRADIGIEGSLPFRGEDVWHAYELNWLTTSGKPEVAALRVNVPCNSPCLVESKSLKLYLNSFAQTRFTSRADVLQTLNSDLGVAFRAPVMVELLSLAQIPEVTAAPAGVCLDGLEVNGVTYERAPALLHVENESGQRLVKETLFSNLFRSVCPVTGQPDFATMIVQYVGRPIRRTALLEYLISFRQHAAFHEAAVEQIFMDISARCAPEQLSVCGKFLRRGGIDISPFRSDQEDRAPVLRLPRQ